MGRPRKTVAVVPWVRSTDAPLPDNYRVNFVLRDPELIALLVRGVPHGQITKSMERLMREGYDRMVAVGQIDPNNHLTSGERALIQSGHRKAAKAERAAQPSPGEAAETPVRVSSFRAPAMAVIQTVPVAKSANGRRPPGADPLDGPPPGAREIDEDDANVLLGAQG